MVSDNIVDSTLHKIFYILYINCQPPEILVDNWLTNTIFLLLGIDKTINFSRLERL